MKRMKAVNCNLLLIGIPALLILLAGIGLYGMGNALLDAIQETAPETPQGQVGDVEGYAYLLELLGSGFQGLASLLVLMMAVLLAGYGGVILLLTLVARAVYRQTPGRILAYRVIMGIDLFILALPAPSLLRSWIDGMTRGEPSGWPLLGLILLVVVVAFGCRNTYTDRIGAPMEAE